MDRAKFLSLVEDRRQALGYSMAELSERAFGSRKVTAVQDLKRGSSPSIERISALCEALDLEFYIGKKRDSGVINVVMPAGDLEHDYALISSTNAEAAAGAGRYVSELEEREPLAFRRDWLAKLDVTPSRAVLLRARGESMEPLIWDGDVMMIDTDRTEPRVRPEGRSVGRGFQDEIFVLRLGDDLRVKAVRRPSQDKVVLYSENRSRYEPEVLTGADLKELAIIGKVVWWGHVSN
ncbi:LexA family transcriptional regulator [Pseudooceanicola sp. 502str34]